MARVLGETLAERERVAAENAVAWRILHRLVHRSADGGSSGLPLIEELERGEAAARAAEERGDDGRSDRRAISRRSGCAGCVWWAWCEDEEAGEEEGAAWWHPPTLDSHHPRHHRDDPGRLPAGFAQQPWWGEETATATFG